MLSRISRLRFPKSILSRTLTTIGIPDVILPGYQPKEVPRCETTSEKLFPEALSETVSVKGLNYAIIRSANKWGQKEIGLSLGPETIWRSPQMYQLQRQKEKSESICVFNESVDLPGVSPDMYPIQDDDTVHGIWNGHLVNSDCYQLYQMNQLLYPNVDRIINLMGDHSSAIGSIGASLDCDPKTLVVWIDAYPGLVAPKDTQITEAHRMAINILTQKLHLEGLFDWLPQLPNDQIMDYGTRWAVHEEKSVDIMETVMDWSVAYWKMMETKNDQNYGRNIHVSIDVNAVDQQYINSGVPSATVGLKPSVILFHLYALSRVGHIKTVDIAGFNPRLNQDNMMESMEYIISMLNEVL